MKADGTRNKLVLVVRADPMMDRCVGFPGNVRELENVIQRIIVLGDPDLRRSPLPVATRSWAPYKISGPGRTAAISLKDISRKAARVAEREAMLQALEQTRWNRIQAAKLLGISYRALLYKIKEAELDRQSASNPQPGRDP